MFDRNVFLAAFAVSIEALCQSESVTKRELQALSRSVLEYSIETGDVGPLNRLMAVLTPVNKKVAGLYFQHFAGFSFDPKNSLFTGKSKKRWDEAVKLAKEFLSDPMNNIWSWAERNVEVETKPFNLDKVTDAFKGFMKKAAKENLTQKDVLKAVLKAGVELDTILALMGEMYDVDVKTGETQE